MSRQGEGFLVHRCVLEVDETCTYGDKHRVRYFLSKRLWPTGETYKHTHGYGDESDARILEDAQGRLYHEKPPLDYYGGTSYYCKEQGTLWNKEPRYYPARDVLGRPLNDRTPAGPPLKLEPKVAIDVKM